MSPVSNMTWIIVIHIVKTVLGSFEISISDDNVSNLHVIIDLFIDGLLV